MIILIFPHVNSSDEWQMSDLNISKERCEMQDCKVLVSEEFLNSTSVSDQVNFYVRVY